MTSLATEVARFRRWSRTTRQDPADWSACYPHWREVYDAVELTLAEGLLSPEITAMLLFLVTSDHANQRVLELLAASPMAGYQVATLGVTHPDAETRRQVALLLGRLPTLGAIELLRKLTEDEDHGVCECALAVLDPLDPQWTRERRPRSGQPESES